MHVLESQQLHSCVEVSGPRKWSNTISRAFQQLAHQATDWTRSALMSLSHNKALNLSLVLAGLVSRSQPLLAWLKNISALCITILTAHQTTTKSNLCLSLSSFWVFIHPLSLSLSPHVLVLMSVMNKGRTLVFWGWIWRLVLIHRLTRRLHGEPQRNESGLH